MISIDSRSFQPSVCQATFYTPRLDHTTSKVMSSFYPKVAHLFDAGPEVIPNLLGFPPDLPQITLKNKPETLRLEIAAARINFFSFMNKPDERPLDIKQFYDMAVQIISDFIVITECKVGRIAAVRIVFAIHENPGLFLAQHFCKDSWNGAPLNRPQNFELHAHKVFELDRGLPVNSWVRAKTGDLKISDSKQRIVLFEQDLNTMAEECEKKELQQSDIENFFKRVVPEFDHILSLYFPILEGAK